MTYADKISLIRHYPHVKNAAHAEFESLVTKKLVYWVSETEQTRMDELERNELKFQTFEELTEDVRQKISRCLDANNEFLFCYEPTGTAREIDTARDLIERFRIPEGKILKIEMPGPSGNAWTDYVSSYRVKLNSILVKASKEDVPAKEIVLIWRRSDSYSFLNYAPLQQTTWAHMAREILEKQAVITMDIEGRLYPWLSYFSVLAAIDKNANMRKLKKIVESGEVYVNGMKTGSGFLPRLTVGDSLRYKNRTAEIGISDDWYPVVIRVSQD